MPFVYLIIVFLFVIFGLVIIRGAPFVPSRRSDVKKALQAYQLSNRDVLVDLGSGAGGVLRLASKAGATAIGYEINPILVFISGMVSFNDKKVRVRLADFWLIHLPKDTTVVYIFSIERDMQKLKTWMQSETNRIGKRLHLISYGFEIVDMKSQNTGAHFVYTFNPLHGK